MRQKLITLCPTTFEIAQKMPNFSAWVRGKLFEESKQPLDESQILFKYKCPVCKIEQLDVIRRPRECLKCKYAMEFKGQVTV